MLQSVPLATEDLEFKSPIEWEERQVGFFLENYWLTLKRLLLAPTKFFENLRRNGSYFRPLLFAVIAELVTASLSSLIYGGIFSGFLLGGTGHWGILGADFKIFSLGLGFLGVIAALFGSAFCYYLVAWCFGVRSNLRTMFRTYAYSEGCVYFRLIPVVGIWIAEIVRLVLLTAGFRAVYRFQVPRAVSIALIAGLIILALSAIGGFSYHQLFKV